VESKNPKAGKYTIVLDPVRVPEEGLKVAYRDVVYHTVFGTVTSNDTATELKPGEIKRAAVSLMCRHVLKKAVNSWPKWACSAMMC